MTISALGLLGKDVSVQRMLSEFENSTHFYTYAGERNPSYSSNCNVCMCLLRRDNVFDYTTQVVKSAAFLSRHWYAGNTKDKWVTMDIWYGTLYLMLISTQNVSKHYLMMLVAKAFTKFLSRWEAGKLDNSKIPHSLVHQQIPVILLEILMTTVDSQILDGSWDNKHEVTAYAILTLDAISKLSWISKDGFEVSSSIRKGQAYLNDHHKNWSYAEYLWIEKVAYGSSNLSIAYCLAALKVEVTEMQLLSNEEPCQEFDLLAIQKSQAMKSFFAKIPAFKNEKPWKIELWLLQASFFIPSFVEARLHIFPRKNVGADKYLQFIPFTWISSANSGIRLNLDLQWSMMLISMLIYQVDEFMEAVVGQDLLHDLEWVKGLIGYCCRPTAEDVDSKRSLSKSSSEDDHFDGTRKGNIRSEKQKPSDAQNRNDVKISLEKFILYVRQHPRVLNSSAWLQTWLVKELESFLLSHVAHIEDCQLFTKDAPVSEQPSIFKHARASYYDWLRTTASNSTSCPFAFVFFLCLIDEPSKEALADGVPRYLAQSACRHLANMCRQHNDFGSVVRDRVEHNVNSINFAEIRDSTNTQHPSLLEGKEAVLKEKLLQVAEYERRCRDNALDELDRLVDPRLMRNLRIFVKVTDLYGQIYLVKDVSPYKVSKGQL